MGLQQYVICSGPKTTSWDDTIALIEALFVGKFILQEVRHETGKKQAAKNLYAEQLSQSQLTTYIARCLLS